MIIVIQRVKEASVESEGVLCGTIKKGLLLYIGVVDGDTKEDALFMANKIPNLRIFYDDNDKMNLSLMDIGGEILAVSQFTLAGDCRHGRRPSFTKAMKPEPANELYEALVTEFRKQGITVETGVFRTDMDVSSVNWGPVTFILDSKEK